MSDQVSRAVHSVEVGDADAPQRVVFLHGIFGRGKNFTRIANGLLPDALSLLVDLPNHGQSGWTDSIDYPQLADQVAEHLRQGFAVNGPVDVVGHSMGGKVAMVLALRHPELVRRLTIIDIAPTQATPTRGGIGHLLSTLIDLDLSTVERRNDADDFLRKDIPEDAVRGFLLQNLKRGGESFEWEPNLHLLNAELDTIMGFPEVGEVQFTGPVLWINGDQSDYVKAEDAPAMRALFPRAIRMTVRGAGHWVHSEKPEETVAALRSFLLR